MLEDVRIRGRQLRGRRVAAAVVLAVLVTGGGLLDGAEAAAGGHGGVVTGLAVRATPTASRSETGDDDGLPPPTASVFAFSPSTLWLLVSTPQGSQQIWRTDDAGRHWVDVTPARVAAPAVQAAKGGLDVNVVDADTAWTNLADTNRTDTNRTLFTVDGGLRWTILTAPKGCHVLQFVSSRVGWCETYVLEPVRAIKLYRTEDGGLRWAFAGPSVEPQRWTAGLEAQGCGPTISFTSPTRGSALECLDDPVTQVEETANGGRTWTDHSLTDIPTKVRSGEVQLVDPPELSGNYGAGTGVVYEVPHPGDIVAYPFVYRSRDGGQTWRPVVPPGPFETWDVDIVSPLVWRLAIDDEILSTDNGGLTWTTIHPSWPVPANEQSNVTISFESATGGWASYGGKVMTTSNGGRTWTVASLIP